MLHRLQREVGGVADAVERVTDALGFEPDVDREGDSEEEVTRQADLGILRGITRTVLIDVVAAQGLELEERSFTPEEAYGAREAFLTSASQVVVPVVRIDDRPIGNGVPGSIATALRAKFHCYGERT